MEVNEFLAEPGDKKESWGPMPTLVTPGFDSTSGRKTVLVTLESQANDL